MLQTPMAGGSVIVLTGLSQQGLTEWVFVPKGWDVEGVLRRFRFSGTARSRQRQCLATPASVRELVALYGEEAGGPVAPGATLTELLSKALIAVELTITVPQRHLTGSGAMARF